MNQSIITQKTKRSNQMVADKLRSLMLMMQNANKGFKRIAERCHNQKTKIVVFGLATESFQFHKELSSHIQVLEGKPNMNEVFTNFYNTSFTPEQSDSNEDGSKVLDECAQIEKNMITEFRKLLNDHLIAGDLRKLLQEHLNGFLYAFVKLKMLRNYNNKVIDYGIMF